MADELLQDLWFHQAADVAVEALTVHTTPPAGPCAAAPRRPARPREHDPHAAGP
ncbi:hypothetical protein [Streptomyces sp. NBC_01264]|uniref:hypothetical protein n=1 Tax=Streptomyces sp. NBC_01264 TaxID=2903804 RepID=UPI00224DEB23|nr:hypothetical protein [Streptomyces sp. NBC_01264]MCX4775442.1 hypothetical protein [Streptomyces sp. NBC_01264]